MSAFWVCNIDKPTRLCRFCEHFYPHKAQVVQGTSDFCNDSHKCREQNEKTVSCVIVEDKCS